MSVFDVGSTLNYLIELSKCVWQAADKSSLTLSRKALLSWLLQRNRVAQLMNKKTGVISGRSKMMRGKNLANPVTTVSNGFGLATRLKFRIEQFQSSYYRGWKTVGT